MSEQTNPGIFHIHIDARVMPEQLERYAKENGFYNDSFSGHPEGYRHFEPNVHATRKVRTAGEFNETWTCLERKAEETGLVGYIEGEYVPSDEVIERSRYTKTHVPFSINRRRLTDEEKFRQSELHLTLDGNESDSRLVKSLLDAGLYGAYLPKRGKKYLVLTAQGYRDEIKPLMETLRAFLNEAGGAVDATMKEERVVKYKLFGISAAELPEVIDSVDYSFGVLLTDAFMRI